MFYEMRSSTENAFTLMVLGTKRSVPINFHQFIRQLTQWEQNCFFELKIFEWNFVRRQQNLPSNRKRTDWCLTSISDHCVIGFRWNFFSFIRPWKLNQKTKTQLLIQFRLRIYAIHFPSLVPNTIELLTLKLFCVCILVVSETIVWPILFLRNRIK